MPKVTVYILNHWSQPKVWSQTLRLPSPVRPRFGPLASVTAVTYPTSSPSGATVTITATIKNIGDIAAPCWAQVRDRDANTVVGARQESSPVPVGGTTNFTWNLTMPAHTWNLRVEAAAGLANPMQAYYDFTITFLDAFANITGVDYPSSANVNQVFNISVHLKNTGTLAKVLWSRIFDLYTGFGATPNQGSVTPVAVGGSVTLTWSVTMPNRDWALLAEAWH